MRRKTAKYSPEFFHIKMMWSLWILLGTALSVDGYVVPDLHKRLSHGLQLKIYLLKSAEKLEFTPAAQPLKTYLRWERGARTTRGKVSGTGNDKSWYLDKVTYKDQGTYVQRDYWNKEISSLKVAVTTRREYTKCVAGEELHISLEGIDQANATLSFSGANANVTLVHDGAVVAQDLPDYWNRVKTLSTKISIQNVNTSDVGNYTLKDTRDRVVSIVRMELTDGYVVPNLHMRLSHGLRLKILLPKSAEKLEFTPAAQPLNTYLYWERGARTTRGKVSGTGNDRSWYLDKVTYKDQGTYVQRDYRNKEISSLKVAVTTRRKYTKCVAGKELHISLEGIDQANATLSFSGANAKVTLVHDGAVVAQDLPGYWNRVKTLSTKISIQNVNTLDVGYYTLKDTRDRVVSIVRMELIDKHKKKAGKALLALLLLLGIPASICLRYWKKIFKNKSPDNTSIQLDNLETLHPPPGYNMPGGGVSPGSGVPTFYHGPGPDPNMGGYPQAYPPPNPGMPGQPQWTGPPPQPCFNPGYPPQDPMYPPAQPLQWNSPPPNQPQYNPGAPPMGYAPVMYSAPSGKEEIKMSPVDPLLAHPPPQGPPPASEALHSTDGAFQFNNDTGKNAPTNFL